MCKYEATILREEGYSILIFNIKVPSHDQGCLLRTHVTSEEVLLSKCRLGNDALSLATSSISWLLGAQNKVEFLVMAFETTQLSGHCLFLESTSYHSPLLLLILQTSGPPADPVFPLPHLFHSCHFLCQRCFPCHFPVPSSFSLLGSNSRPSLAPPPMSSFWLNWLHGGLENEGDRQTAGVILRCNQSWESLSKRHLTGDQTPS